MIIVAIRMEAYMDIKKPKAVIGTNSWGGAVAAKVFRGSSVDDQTLRKTIDTAKENGSIRYRRYYYFCKIYPIVKNGKKKSLRCSMNGWKRLRRVTTLQFRRSQFRFAVQRVLCQFAVAEDLIRLNSYMKL